MRKKALTDHEIPSIMPGEMSSKKFRRNWARLIQKIYEVDPLTCPGCKGKMRLISFIDNPVLIKKILQHLNLWDTCNHDPPAKDRSHISGLIYDDSDSQIPPYDYWN
jgi:hypothetical protein